MLIPLLLLLAILFGLYYCKYSSKPNIQNIHNIPVTINNKINKDLIYQPCALMHEDIDNNDDDVYEDMIDNNSSEESDGSLQLD